MRCCLSLSLCFALLAGTLAAQDKEERLWTGVNGKTFRGTFQTLSPDRKTAEFLSADGKTLRVELDKLAQADRERLLRPAPAAEKTPDGFREIPPPPRKPDMVQDPLAAGGSNGGPIVDALWSALMWWDITNVVKVPGRGDLDKRGIWLHKKLTDLVEKGGGNSGAADARAGVEQYFATELKGVATCRVTVEQNDLSRAYLSRAASGADAVVLRMSMTYDNGRDFGVSMMLEEMTPEGKFSVLLCGKRLTGTATPVAGDGAGTRGLNEMEWIISNEKDLPELYRKNGARFHTRQQTFNAAISIHPLVYSEAGKPVAPPPAGVSGDDNAPWVQPTIHQGPRKVAPEFPIKFTTPVSGLRDWKTKTGSTLRAVVASAGSNQVSLKSADGRTVSVDTRQLAEEDAACAALWLACQGQPRAFPRLRLAYQVQCPAARGKFVISTEGTLCRVDEIKPPLIHFMTFDMKDGIYYSESRGLKNGKPNIRRTIGRFEPEKLLPREIESRHTQSEIDFFLDTLLPAAGESPDTPAPSRKVLFPLSVHGIPFRNPEIDFVMHENPAILAGLYHVLSGGTPGGDSEYYAFSVQGIYGNRDEENLFPILAACKMLPLRMAWTNKRNERAEPESYRAENAGKFLMSLEAASIPDAFPAGHFAIPAGARALPAGSQERKETAGDP